LQLAKVQRLEADVTTRQAGISRIERELAQLEANNVDELEKRRRAAEQEAEEERRSAYPFVDRTNFRRPLYFPNVRGLACPVDGGQFINDWAFPRPGGRTHEGTDVFAPIGTPIVATAGGTVTEVNRVDRFSGNIRRGLGGRTVTVTTEDGERWYYAHLHEIAPGIDVGTTVEIGEQVGSVGDSGNARGGAPHLHIGRYVDRIAVNPWPALYVSCREEPEG
jgi:murein DD-endopeptidase MepM/ murein hydrolase activator NlpD